MSLSGNVCMALGFFFLGPAPFLPIAPSVKLTFVMVSIVGVGYASVMVSSFTRSHRAAMRKGYVDDIGTNLIISSKFMVTYLQGKTCFIINNEELDLFLGPSFKVMLINLKIISSYRFMGSIF